MAAAPRYWVCKLCVGVSSRRVYTRKRDLKEHKLRQHLIREDDDGLSDDSSISPSSSSSRNSQPSVFREPIPSTSYLQPPLLGTSTPANINKRRNTTEIQSSGTGIQRKRSLSSGYGSESLENEEPVKIAPLNQPLSPRPYISPRATSHPKPSTKQTCHSQEDDRTPEDKANATCPFCEKLCKSVKACERHIGIHTRPFKCMEDDCVADFSEEYLLRKHVLDVHLQQVEAKKDDSTSSLLITNIVGNYKNHIAPPGPSTSVSSTPRRISSESNHSGDFCNECNYATPNLKRHQELRHHQVKPPTLSNKSQKTSNVLGSLNVTTEEIPLQDLSILSPVSPDSSTDNGQFQELLNCAEESHLTLSGTSGMSCILSHKVTGRSIGFKCKVCGNKFLKSSEALAHHHSLHTERSPLNHRCAECNLQFTTELELKTHSKAHERQEQVEQDRDTSEEFKCKHCQKNFPYQNLLDKHNSNYHQNKETLPANKRPRYEGGNEFDEFSAANNVPNNILQSIPSPPLTPVPSPLLPSDTSVGSHTNQPILVDLVDEDEQDPITDSKSKAPEKVKKRKNRRKLKQGIFNYLFG